MRRRRRDERYRMARARWIVRRRAELLAEHQAALDRDWFRMVFFGTGSPDTPLAGIMDFINAPLSMNPAQNRVVEIAQQMHEEGKPVRLFIPKARRSPVFETLTIDTFVAAIKKLDRSAP